MMSEMSDQQATQREHIDQSNSSVQTSPANLSVDRRPWCHAASSVFTLHKHTCDDKLPWKRIGNRENGTHGSQERQAYLQADYAIVFPQAQR